MGIISIFVSETFTAITTFIDSFSSGNWENVVHATAGLLWSPLLIFLALGAGLWFSINSRFIQIRRANLMGKYLFSSKASDEGVSSFQSFALALSGRLGTGNIVGTATAIAYGGPGAIFWMWMIAIVGASSSFVESTMGQIFKEEMRGEYRGGPAFFLQKLGHPILSKMFLFAAIIAMGLLLPGIQANTISTSIEQNFGIDKMFVMIFVVVLLAAILLGGTKRIVKFNEAILPAMSIIFVIVAIIICISNYESIIPSFKAIFAGAFGLDPLFGGLVGSSVLWGVKRGIFSNEAGMGTGAHIAASAEVHHPAKQGMIQSFSIYFDTLLINTVTALVILTTNKYSVLQPGTRDADGVFQTFPGADFMGGNPETIVAYVPDAFNVLLGSWGSKFVAIAIFFFAFTCFLAFYYYSSTNLELLLKGKNPKLIENVSTGFKVILICAVFFFGIQSNAVAWSFADIGFGFMAFVNFIGMLLVAKPAFIAMKNFDEKISNKQYEAFFIVEELPEEQQKHFKEATFWHRDEMVKRYGAEHIEEAKDPNYELR